MIPSHGPPSLIKFEVHDLFGLPNAFCKCPHCDGGERHIHFFPATPYHLNNVAQPQPTASAESFGCQPTPFNRPPHPWDNHYWFSIKTLLSKPPEQCSRPPYISRPESEDSRLKTQVKYVFSHRGLGPWTCLARVSLPQVFWIFF